MGHGLAGSQAEDSFSLLPLLKGQADAFDRAPVVHHSLDGMFAVRQGRWKMVLGLGSGGFSDPQRGYSVMPNAPAGQLYDMVDDWREQHNVWNEHPEVVARLKAVLVSTRESGRSLSAD